MAEILQPKQLEKEGYRAYKASDFLRAAEYFKAAKLSFQTTGNLKRMAEMANNCNVALLRVNDADGALRVLNGVDIIFETEGDIRGLAITLGNRAATLEALGRSEEAIKNYRKASELFKRCGDSELYTHTQQALSTLLLRSGHSLEALATMQAGINQIGRPNIPQRFLKRLLGIPFRLMNR